MFIIRQIKSLQYSRKLISYFAWWWFWQPGPGALALTLISIRKCRFIFFASIFYDQLCFLSFHSINIAYLLFTMRLLTRYASYTILCLAILFFRLLLPYWFTHFSRIRYYLQVNCAGHLLLIFSSIDFLSTAFIICSGHEMMELLLYSCLTFDALEVRQSCFRMMHAFVIFPPTISTLRLRLIASRRYDISRSQCELLAFDFRHCLFPRAYFCQRRMPLLSFFSQCTLCCQTLHISFFELFDISIVFWLMHFSPLFIHAHLLRLRWYFFATFHTL